MGKAARAQEWRYSGVNRPIAGPTHDAALPVGKHPLQLYSRGTPNGVKVTVMLEELLALGHSGAEYDAWLIDIGKGEQFGSGFVEVNPNSKIPASDGPERSQTSSRVRVRIDPALSRREIRRVPAVRSRQAHRDAELAVLADGEYALRRRRVRSFLSLRARQDRVCDQPVCDGGEAPAGCARSAPQGPRVHGWRRVLDRRYGDLALVWRAWRRGHSTMRANSCRGRSTFTSSAGQRRLPSGPPSSAAGWSTVPWAILLSSCTSAMMQATSIRRRKTS